MDKRKNTKPTKKKPVNTDTVTVSRSDVADSRYKRITIHYNDMDVPVIQFHGKGWVGKDISLLTQMLPRAYRTYKLTLRRKGV